jgi:DNA gyrase subunit A
MAKEKKPATPKVPASAEERVLLPGAEMTPYGQILPQGIVEEVSSSYLDYAMSVIVQRALPDARDGMKPVHRRILYAMWDVGLRSTAKFRKSATVVGEVLGKYHPHGDSAVYEAMVRMAQDFSLRYPLVKGQGNFGSVDGDSAAAMRYTEAKLSGIAEELLLDIDEDTVNFIPNYDGSHQEPQVLPGRLPNLLLNGSTGIAVGMATSIPPHNLSELIDAITHLASHPDCDVDDLLQFVKGPDFPTGGTIYDWDEIKAAYHTGKGRVLTRAVAEIVERSGKRAGEGYDIIVTELPYAVNKSTLLESIAEQVKDKKLDGIRDLRDESDKDGIRVVIELKKDAYPQKVLNSLYKHTQLQETFHVNLLALVDGIQPKVLNLKSALEEYLKHRQVVIRRRTEFRLGKAKDRAHILEGLAMALEDIDRVIAVIKKSQDKDDAKVNLIAKFKFSDRQADAILEMRLQQLANLERLKVEEELKTKKKLIKELEELLSSVKAILKVVIDELGEIKEKFGDERRTKVVRGKLGAITVEDMIPDEAAVITLTRDGYLKRLPPDSFKVQGRGGKGVIGLTTKEEDLVEHLFSASTHDDLLFFTSLGRVFQLRAYEVPQGSRTAKGQAVVNFLQLAPNEKVSSIFTVNEKEGFKYLVMVTRRGLIKKVAVDAFAKVRRSGLIALKLKGDDSLRWVRPATGSDDIMLVSKQGMAIRFKEKDVRAMGRNAAGVRGMRLRDKDEIVGMELIDHGKPGAHDQLLVVMGQGFGKRTALGAYKVQGRGGMGIKTAQITPKTGAIESALIVNGQALDQDLIVMSAKGQVIRLPLKSISVLGRQTQGVRIMKFKEEKDEVASLTYV